VPPTDAMTDIIVKIMIEVLEHLRDRNEGNETGSSECVAFSDIDRR
jgi:hypothetical protein